MRCLEWEMMKGRLGSSEIHRGVESKTWPISRGGVRSSHTRRLRIWKQGTTQESTQRGTETVESNSKQPEIPIEKRFNRGRSVIE